MTGPQGDDWSAFVDAEYRHETMFDSLRRADTRSPLQRLRRDLAWRRSRSMARDLSGRVVAAVPVNEVGQRITRSFEIAVERVRPVTPYLRTITLTIAAISALHLVFPKVTDAFAAALLAPVSRSTVEKASEAEACARSRAVVDAGGELVGAVPRFDCEHRPFLTAPVSAVAAAAMHPAWVAAEGEYRSSWRTVLGLNLVGWSRALLQWIGLLNGHSGGSSPLETALDNVMGRPGALDLLEKVGAGFHTAAFTASRLDTEEARDQFVTENIPCARGATGSLFGFTIAGELCSRLLFGKSSEDLSWAERCVWVASAQRQFIVPGAGTTPAAIEHARSVEKRIRRRASAVCLTRLARMIDWSAERLAGYQHEVAGMDLVLSRHEPGRIISSSVGRSMPELQYMVTDEARLAGAGEDGVPLRLNASSALQQRAAAGVERVMSEIADRLGSLLCYRNCDGGRVGVEYAVAVARINGDSLETVLAASNRHELLSGPIERIDDTYHRARSTRSPGSTNKVWLVPDLVTRGIERLCSETPVGRDAWEDENRLERTCPDGRGMMTLAEAVERSDNGALMDGAIRLGGERIEQVYRSLGFDFDDSLSEMELFDGLVLGYRVTASPAVLMRNMAALYRGYRGEPPVSSLPRVFSDLRPQGHFDWRTLGIDGATLERAGHVLRRPVLGKRGTLRHLATVLTGHGCTAPVGKTGTSDSVVRKEVRDRLVLAAFSCAGKSYVAFGMIGSPSIGIPLGAIHTSDVVALVDVLISQLVAKGDNNG